MEPWVFEDGTRVWLGGKVAGGSDVAAELRERIALARSSGLVSSGYGLIPSCEPLDVNVPHLMDHWLRSFRRLSVVSGPAVEYPPTEPADGSGPIVMH